MADWSNRSNPHMHELIAETEAMALAAKHGMSAELVWLTRAPQDEPDDDCHLDEQCPALRISAFLGKYDLIRTI
jgi:hypothetical protein